MLPTSCHPSHICKNIPQSVITRVKRNCSTQETYQDSLNDYIGFLQERNYSDEIIESAVKVVNDKSRDSLIHKPNSTKHHSRSFPLVVKYNPNLPNMNKIVHDNLHILNLHPNTKQLFEDKILVSHKMESNIKDLLTSSRYKEPTSDTTHQINDEQPGSGCIGCGKCTLCINYLVETNLATSFNTTKSFPIKGTVTCQSNYVIYQIRDIVCEIDYVGYSSNIKSRWANHKSHIKKNIKSCELSTHINLKAPGKHQLDRDCQKNYDRDLKTQLRIILLEEVNIRPDLDDKKIIEIMEAREYIWQCQLKATSKLGGICKRVTKTSKKSKSTQNSRS